MKKNLIHAILRRFRGASATCQIGLDTYLREFNRRPSKLRPAAYRFSYPRWRWYKRTRMERRFASRLD
jgi:hypothetical protein